MENREELFELPHSTMSEKLIQISVSIELDDVKRTLRVADWEQVKALLEVSRPLISARAAYRVSFIEQKTENQVIIDGVCLNSRVLRKNLEAVRRVFPFVITIGAQLEQRGEACADFLEKYYLDTIGNMGLRKARKYLEGHLCSRFALTGLSSMSPGSLPDWPIEEQRPLFSILRGAEASIGVTLTEHLLMIPKKSVSGIYFPTDVTFYSCQLCPRERCEGRKAPYDKGLVEKYEN